MSLLLDALKRAEQEKLARQPAGSPAAHAPAGSARAHAPAANASLELQPITTGASAAPHAAHGTSAQRADPAQAAQNVFQAKGTDPDAPRNRTVLWVTFTAIALVAIAAATYVWFSVNSLTPQYASTPRPRPTSTPAPGAPLPPTAAMGSIVPARDQPSATSSVTTTESAPAGEPSAAAAVAPTPAATAPTPPLRTPESAAEELARAAAVAPPSRPPLRMDRAPEAGRRVPAEVAAGYEALRQGNSAAARRSYEAALATDPNNVDAHLGLATLAAQGANRAAAANHYRRALDLDPRNPTALAGLASIADYSRPEGLEAQLRADLARFPESSALHYTLGNLYSAQARWTEAQAAYFEAHRLDPGSAEIAHNLAVALDHLGQGRLAADFYGRALDSARGHPAPFDAAAVSRRLSELR